MEWNDWTPRSVAARLVQPAWTQSRSCALLSAAGLPFTKPWNVTEHEVALALALYVPINGTCPEPAYRVQERG